MSRDRLVLGTRGSRLARIQSEFVAGRLRRGFPDLEVELRVIKTKGDEILDTALSKIGDKGLFTREIERQMLDGQIDLAVHSLKDLPTELPAGLKLAAITAREDPADVLVCKIGKNSKNGCKLAELPVGARVLSGSLRRKTQVLHRRGDLEVVDVRGNIDTRLRKLDEGDAEAMLMAAAGLRRAGLAERITERFEPKDFLPGIGQGALAIEIRSDDEKTAGLAAILEDAEARATTTAERSMLAKLEGGCQVPVGGFGWIEGDELFLKGMVSDLAGSKLIKAQSSIKMQSSEKVQSSQPVDRAAELGVEVAEKLIAMGGGEILMEILAKG
ncbi:MAG: hydroxymethylbilane synthase [Sedimentisphaerales bacterium]|nr:hydroxymethylbilane synthase [Sedimentisphaerales bacterium]